MDIVEERMKMRKATDGRVQIKSFGNKLYPAKDFDLYLVMQTNEQDGYGHQMPTTYHYNLPPKMVEDAISKGGMRE